MPVSDVMRGAGYAEARARFNDVLPIAHRRFVEETAPSAVVGDYYFCHAGVKPGVALTAQNSEDLLWIREEFLHHTGPFGKIVVHGHTPVERPEVRSNRINIDTGAYASANLTALVLEGDTRRFLSTQRR